LTNINLKNKINYFLESIYSKLNAEQAERLQVLADEMEIKIDNIKEEYEVKKDKAMEENKKVYDLKKVAVFTKEKAEINKEILRLQQKATEDIMLELVKRIQEYVNSAEYKATLPKTVATYFSLLEKDDYNIYLTKKDVENLKEGVLANVPSELKNRISICATNINILGGFIIENKKRTFRVDNSLTTILESKQELVGMEILKILPLERNG